MIDSTSREVAHRALDDDAALEASIQAALAETVQRHRLHGIPLAVWRDGRLQLVVVGEAYHRTDGRRAEHE